MRGVINVGGGVKNEMMWDEMGRKEMWKRMVNVSTGSLRVWTAEKVVVVVEGKKSYGCGRLDVTSRCSK